MLVVPKIKLGQNVRQKLPVCIFGIKYHLIQNNNYVWCFHLGCCDHRSKVKDVRHQLRSTYKLPLTSEIFGLHSESDGKLAEILADQEG